MSTQDVTSGVELDIIEDGEEPSIDESQSVGGDTQDNEDAKLEATAEEGGAAKRASEIISEQGNHLKNTYGKLVELAKSSDTAKQMVKEMVLKDPAAEKYLKQKYGTDYDLIMSDKSVEAPVSSESVDLEEIRRQERARAQAEAILNEAETTRQKTVRTNAERLGFTSEELATYERHFNTLLKAGESEEKALDGAAVLTNRDKALAQGSRPNPTTTTANEPAPVEKRPIAKISRGLLNNLEARGMATPADLKAIAETQGRMDPATGNLLLPDFKDQPQTV